MPSPFLARPFAALQPPPERRSDVIAPPYDVASTDEANALAANRPYSFLHISRPEIDLPPGSSAVFRRGLRARCRQLARLRDGGVLVRDRDPAFYVYRMVMDGRAPTGVALVASVAAYERTGFAATSSRVPTKKSTACETCNTQRANRARAAGLSRECRPRRADVAAATANRCSPCRGRTASCTRLARGRAATIAALSAALDALDALYIADGHHCAAAVARVALHGARPARRSRATNSFSRWRFRTMRCGSSTTTAWSPT